MRRVAWVCVGVIALFGCGQSEDGNVSEGSSGKWESTTTIESVQFGDEYFEGEALPEEFQGVQGTAEQCSTGRWMSREQFERDLEKRLGGSCKLSSYDLTADTLEGSGKCDQVADASLDYYPELIFDGTLEDDSADLSVALEGGATDPETGRRIWIKMLAKVESRRTGDC